MASLDSKMNRPYLAIENITKSYGSLRALRGVSLKLNQGDILCLLGPSGCGKTTLLNIIGGFLSSSSGEIWLDGQQINALPAHKRLMSMCFQDYALFPHMNVLSNVMFGLEMRHVDKSKRKKMAQESLSLVRLEGVEQKYPDQLSGGQQQRVALARALVVSPRLLLLDEPLSNLDAILRRQMRTDIREILKRAGTTAIMVTHDHEEAISMADQVALLNEGTIAQAGPPKELYERPDSVFAATFLEMGNLFNAEVTRIDDGVVEVDSEIGLLKGKGASFRIGETVVAAIRPERFSVGVGSADNMIRGRVTSVTYLGKENTLDVKVRNANLSVNGYSDESMNRLLGQDVTLSCGVEDVAIIRDA